MTDSVECQSRHAWLYPEQAGYSPEVLSALHSAGSVAVCILVNRYTTLYSSYGASREKKKPFVSAVLGSHRSCYHNEANFDVKNTILKQEIQTAAHKDWGPMPMARNQKWTTRTNVSQSRGNSIRIWGTSFDLCSALSYRYAKKQLWPLISTPWISHEVRLPCSLLLLLAQKVL